MYHIYKVLLAGAVFAVALLFPIESRSALVQSTAVRQDSYCYKINGAGKIIYVDHNAAGAICIKPPTIAYTGSPFTFTNGTAITALTPTLGGGAVSSCTAALPAGLAIDSKSCVISGTPTVTSAAADYTITASNLAGSGTAVIKITVNPAAPTILYSGSPFTFTTGTAITALTPTLGGGAVSSCTATLPAGLTIDSKSCVISGTPESVTSAADYSVTASNAGGSGSTTINITVNDVPPSSLSYLTPNVYTVGQPIANNSPTSSGGAVLSYTASPALPAGLDLSLMTGVISGTPTAVTAAADYTVTATNSGGSTTAVLNIAVIPNTQMLISVSPNFGDVSGGTQITVTGAGFGSWTAGGSWGVYLNLDPNQNQQIQCQNFQLQDSQHFTCTTANLQNYGIIFGGIATLTVYDSRDGSWTKLSNAFTYTGGQVPLTATLVSPPSGSVNGGEMITITGTGFDTVPDWAQPWFVYFGSNPGGPQWNCSNVQIVSPTELTCTTPSVGMFNITPYVIFYDYRVGWVSFPDLYTFTGGTDHQKFASVSPSSGPYSSVDENENPITVTVNGSNFGWWTYPYPWFILNGQQVSCDNFNLVDSSHFTCQPGPGWFGGTADLYGYDMRDWSQTVLQKAYTFVGSAPHQTLTSVSPAAGPYSSIDENGNPVTITVTGTNFGWWTTNQYLILNGRWVGCGNFSLVDSSHFTCQPDPGWFGGTADLYVSDSRDWSQSSLMQAYTYLGSAPRQTIISVSPDTVPSEGGTQITVTGTAFDTRWTINSYLTLDTGSQISCDGIQIVDSTHFTCTPASAPLGYSGGTASISVIDSRDYSTSTLSPALTLTGTVMPMSITSITPTSGTTAGGTVITVTGTGLNNAYSYGYIGEGQAGYCIGSAANSTTFTCTTTQNYYSWTWNQPMSFFLYDMRNWSQIYAPQTYTYTFTPMTITSISPTSGPISGGTLITVTGTGLDNAYSYGYIGGGSAGYCIGSAVSSTEFACTTTQDYYSWTWNQPQSFFLYDMRNWNQIYAPQTFTYELSPITVTSVTPSSGNIATDFPLKVDVKGTLFDNIAPWWGYVWFLTNDSGRQVNCYNLNIVSPTEFTCTINNPPVFSTLAGLQLYDMRQGWLTIANVFEFTGGAAHQTLASLSPTMGPYSSIDDSGNPITVTVAGTNFGSWTYYPYLMLNGRQIACSNFSLVDSSHFTCQPGPGWFGGTADFYVYDTRDWSRNSLMQAYTYLGSAPHQTIISVAPTSVPSSGGTQITVTGTAFDSRWTYNPYLTLNTGSQVSCNSFSVVNSTTFVCTPASAPVGYQGGTASITIGDTRDYSTATLSNALTLTGAVLPMTITSISPTGGSASGGTVVTVTGTALNYASSTAYIYYGNFYCNGGSVTPGTDNTKYTCTTGPNSWLLNQGLPFALVDSRNGNWVTAPQTFTYFQCDPNIASSFDGGSGQNSSDPYLISNATQLNAVHANLGCSFKLTADIDLAGIDFAPIGNGSAAFTGTFDGNGHAVLDWSYTNSTNYAYVGFFGQVGSKATVTNLGIENATLSSNGVSNYYSGILAANNQGTITNSYVTGTDTAGALYGMGGFVGSNQGTINTSFSIAMVGGSSSNGTGGFVGMNSGGTISNSYSLGSVTGTASYVGGFVGGNQGTITNSFAAISFGASGGTCGGGSGGGGGGGFGGYNYGTVSGNFWDTQVSNQSRSPTQGYADATGETTASMQTQPTFSAAGWNFDTTWTMSTRLALGIPGYPILRVLPQTAFLALTPGAYDFKIVDVGQTIPASFTLKNLGYATATGLSASIAGAGFDFAGGAYPGTDGTCTDQLFAADSCTITVVFSPQNPGAISGSFSLSFKKGSVVRTLNAALSGRAVQCDPAGVSFGGGSGIDDSDPYLLCTRAQLVAVSTALSSSYHLSADIDLIGGADHPFTPIGTGTYAENDYGANYGDVGFLGSFDGGYHTISNLYYHNAAQNGVGLFAFAKTGSARKPSYIQNLTLRNVDIVGGQRVGALVGRYGYGGGASTITNVTVTGTGGIHGYSSVGGLVGMIESPQISGSSSTIRITAGDSVGGLVGGASYGLIVHSYASGDVTAYGSGVGGLIGGVNTDIKCSYATGNVTAKGDSVGGLIGGSNSNYIVSHTYATGNVSGRSDVGGLIGTSYNGPVYQSYATGDVVGTGTGVGGLIGFNAHWSSDVINCFSTGSVTGKDKVGGLIGQNGESNYLYGMRITNSYAAAAAVTATASGGEASAFIGSYVGTPALTSCFYLNSGGGSAADAHVTGLAAADMATQSTFASANWDFSTPIWRMPSDGGEYPVLEGLPDDAFVFIVAVPQAFTPVRVNETGTKTFTVENRGAAAVTGLSVSPSVTGTGFAFAGGYPGGGTCGDQLAGGATCTVIVTFSPLAAGHINGVLSLSFNDGVTDRTRSTALSASGISCDSPGPVAQGAAVVEDPLVICSGTQLATLSNSLVPYGSYHLNSDLDLTGVSFTPIGSAVNPLTGTFEGNGHVVRNWSYTHTVDSSTTSDYYLGFFKAIGAGGFVNNLGIENATITNTGNNTYRCGIFAGDNAGAITNSYVTGSMSAVNDNCNFMGGFVGFNGGTITNSFSNASMVYSDVRVNGSGIGGFVGYNNGNAITNAFALGSVTVTAATTTGPAPWYYKPHSYYWWLPIYVGGFAGTNYNKINNSYAAVAVSGGDYHGGFSGYIYSAATWGTNETGSFWDTEVSGLLNGFGRDQGDGKGTVATGKTTAELQNQATFTTDLGANAWDFGSTWKMPAAGGYPILNWQP